MTIPPPPTDWHAVALDKLTKVLGPEPARDVMSTTLRAVSLDRIGCAADLRLFAQALVAKGGFAGAIGGLLSVHAAMYDSPW